MSARNTLHVSVPPELATFVGEQIASGSYPIDSEMVRACLRRLADEKREKERRLAPRHWGKLNAR
jgi:putative addiction module CopG family antidote